MLSFVMLQMWPLAIELEYDMKFCQSSQEEEVLLVLVNENQVDLPEQNMAVTHK